MSQDPSNIRYGARVILHNDGTMQIIQTSRDQSKPGSWYTMDHGSDGKIICRFIRADNDGELAKALRDAVQGVIV